MNKLSLFTVLASVMMLVASCSNKIDNLLGELEKAIDDKDTQKIEQVCNTLSSLADDMTVKQAEKYATLAIPAAGVLFESAAGDAMESLSGTIKDATDEIKKAAEDIDVEGLLDDLGDAIDD